MIPLIDLGPWFVGSSDARRSVLHAVDNALSATGFMLVANHGIPGDHLQTARRCARNLFRLPTETKRTLKGPHDSGGWSGLETEAHGNIFGVAAGADLKETFTITPPGAPRHLRDIAPQWYAPTPFPAQVPDMEPSWRELYSDMERLAHALLTILEQALDAEAGYFTNSCTNPMAMLAANWYPSSKVVQPSGHQFRIGPHTDYTTITILDREMGVAGLEIQGLDGSWIPAPYVPGSLVVNTGDFLELWSNGRWPSTRHRVPAPDRQAPSEELLSLVYFHAPDHDAVIRPVHGDAASTRAVNAGDYLAAKTGLIKYGY